LCEQLAQGLTASALRVYKVEVVGNRQQTARNTCHEERSPDGSTQASRPVSSYRLVRSSRPWWWWCVFGWSDRHALALLFRMPGPLVVHIQDDKKEPIMGARVSCTSPTE